MKKKIDSNIRIAPSFPTLTDIEQAMDAFVLCVKLASVEQAMWLSLRQHWLFCERFSLISKSTNESERASARKIPQ